MGYARNVKRSIAYTQKGFVSVVTASSISRNTRGSSVKTKAKGTRFENYVVRFFRDSGIFAMRAPASIGIDVVVYAHRQLFGLECVAETRFRMEKVRKLLDNCSQWGIVPVYCRKEPYNKIPLLTHEAEMRRLILPQGDGS